MRRSPLLVLLVLALVLAAGPPAHGGGFATAGLSSTPEGVDPGQPWKVNITVLQHGRTPLEGLDPVIRIRSGDQEKDFAAVATKKPGVYTAEVVFPAAGRWEYQVLDGFINERPHSFPAVDIGDGAAPAPAPATATRPAAPAPSDDGSDTIWLWGAGAALLAAAGVLALDRRRRRPATAHGAAEPA